MTAVREFYFVVVHSTVSALRIGTVLRSMFGRMKYCIVLRVTWMDWAGAHAPIQHLGRDCVSPPAEAHANGLDFRNPPSR